MAETMALGPDEPTTAGKPAGEQELLRRYVEAGDIQAFRQLVEAHRDMVFSVCRRILRNAADAEDAAQDCFLQLARKAAALKSPIAGWVHQAALHVALDQRERKARREGRETMAARMRSKAEDPHWEDLQGVVDEVVSGLPERLRVPVVLHYLEGRTQEEVAAHLRISQPAVSKQLAQGLELLRKRLKREGLVVSCALLASLLAANAVEAAPPTVSAAIAKIGFTGLAAGVKAAGGKALTIGGISVFKASIVTVVAASALVVGGVVVHKAFAQSPAPPPPTKVVAPAPAPVKAVAPAPVKAPAEKVALQELRLPGNYITVQETDGDTHTVIETKADMTQHMTQSFTILTQVDKPDEQGNTKISVTYKAIKMKMTAPGMEAAFDSDKPDDKNEMAKMWAQMFGPMVGAKIVAVIGPDGKVASVEGMAELWDAVAKNIPNAAIAKMMKEQYGGSEFMEQMIDAGGKMLPPKPVSVGEDWVVHQDMSLPFIGKVNYDQNNQLTELTDTPQGRVATIVFGGQITQTGEHAINVGPAKATLKKFNMTLAGEMHFNMKTGMTVSTEANHDSDMMMSVAQQPGQPAMNMTMRQMMTSKTTTREATAEDLKPRTVAKVEPAPATKPADAPPIVH